MYNIALVPGMKDTLVDTATVVGTAKAIPFSTPPIGGKIFSQITFGYSGTAVIALKVKLEISFDGGTTWSNYTPTDSIDFIAIPSQTMGIQAGALYRINITTLTATNASIIGLIG